MTVFQGFVLVGAVILIGLATLQTMACAYRESLLKGRCTKCFKPATKKIRTDGFFDSAPSYMEVCKSYPHCKSGDESKLLKIRGNK